MTETSFAFPNIFDVSRSKVNIYTSARAIVSRVKLMLLTDPTELYMTPNYGVGLQKYLFTYNTDNVVAMIRDKLIEQLRLWEPSVIPEETKVESGLMYTEGSVEESIANLNHLKLTITLTTADMQQVSFGISSEDFVKAVS